MTKNETEEALKQAQKEYETSNEFRKFHLIYEIALYEYALKYGVDPYSDNILFYYHIEDGKGIKW